MVIYRNKAINKEELAKLLHNQRVSGFPANSPYLDSFFSSEERFELRLKVNNRYNLFFLNGKAVGA